MRSFLVAAVISAALVPAVALAANPGSKQSALVAPRMCHTLQARLGTRAFRTTFRTLGGCVSRLAQVDRLNAQSAESLCRGEQADTTFAATHDGKTFVQFYGHGQNAAKNAFGTCVSTKTSASAATTLHATPNPSRACRSMKTTMTASTFALSFGTNATHRNAFGKCVSLVSRTGVTSVVAAAQACSAELADTTFASTHESKTFAQYYGTNADSSNAFGNCVSQKALAAARQGQQALVAAAKACKAEHAANPTLFRSTYGKRPNAFARCVATKAVTK